MVAVTRFIRWDVTIVQPAVATPGCGQDRRELGVELQRPADSTGGRRQANQTQRLEIEKNKHPMAYPAAAELASRSAKADTENFRQRLPFRPRGTRIGEAADNTHRDTVVDEGNKEAAP